MAHMQNPEWRHVDELVMQGKRDLSVLPSHQKHVSSFSDPSAYLQTLAHARSILSGQTFDILGMVCGLRPPYSHVPAFHGREDCQKFITERAGG